MKSPNKKERNEIYRKALDLLVTGNEELLYGFFSKEWAIKRSGICELLSLVYLKRYNHTDINFEETFPEFFSFRPKESGIPFWWDVYAREIRKDVLTKCIAKTDGD